MENQIEVYAVIILANEAADKVKKLKEIGKRTGYIGVTIHYPLALVLYRSREEQIKAYKEFKRSFDFCRFDERSSHFKIEEEQNDGKAD